MRHLAHAAKEQSTVELSEATLHGPASGEPLPRALQRVLVASLQRRCALTRNPERAERLLAHMAVIGERVSAAWLERFIPEEDREWLDDDLDELIKHDLLRDIDGDRVAFAHGLLRDAVLVRLSPRRARKLHAKAGALLEDRTTLDLAGQRGDHWAAAGEFERAITAWLQAQDVEEGNGQPLRSAYWGSRALAHLAPSDPRHDGCRLAVGRVLSAAAELHRAEETVAPLLDSTDPDVALRATELVAAILGEQTKWAAYRALLEKMERHLEAASDRGRRAFLRARAYYRNVNDLSKLAQDDAERALAMSPPGEEAHRAAARLTWACFHEGDQDGGLRAADRCISESGDSAQLLAEALRLKIVAMTNTADAAGEHAERALDVARRGGQLRRMAMIRNDVAMNLCMAGDIAGAREHAQEAERIAEELGLSMERVRSELYLGFCDMLDGEYASALDALQHPLLSDHLQWFSFYRITLVWAFACAGRHEEALRWLEGTDYAGASAARPFTLVLDHIARRFASSDHDAAKTAAGAIASDVTRRWALLGEASPMSGSTRGR